MIPVGILLALIGLAWLAYLCRDTISGWIPGIKHGIAGWPTAIGGAVLGLLQYIQGQEAAVNTLLAKHPESVPLVMAGLGLIILVLSWVTPRADG